MGTPRSPLKTVHDRFFTLYGLMYGKIFPKRRNERTAADILFGFSP